MSYQALYRKYRPKTFEGLIGQDHIVKTLKGQILTNRVTHAYLFCGTRGTGKTSTAKIFARAINCTEPNDGSACGSCEICLNAERNLNLIEIDAASNNGVDNIRELREEVKYPPSSGKYKVYIIDEVHMLSTGAFNALLKTLEEPPSHAVFILATTDPQKIPATILSRCQRFDFKRITSVAIAKELQALTAGENIEIDSEALKYIGDISDGAMRDALSTLDQCISYFLNKRITLADVQEVVGAVDTTVFYKLADALNEQNSMQCLAILDDVQNEGRNLIHFLSDFITHLRNLLVVCVSKEPTGVLDISEENISRLKQQSESISPERLMYLIKSFSECNIKYSGNPKITLEVLLIKLSNRSFDEDITALKDRIKALENKLENGVVAVPVTAPKPQMKAIEPKAKRVITADSEQIKKSWEKVKSEFQEPIRSMLADTFIETLDGSAIYIVLPSDAHIDTTNARMDIINEVFESSFGTHDLRLISQKEYHNRYTTLYGDNMENEKNPQVRDLIAFFSNQGITVEEYD